MSDRGSAGRRLGEQRRVVHQAHVGQDPSGVVSPGSRARRKGDAAAVAGYVSDMTAQLESMARAEANAARAGASEEGDRAPHI